MTEGIGRVIVGVVCRYNLKWYRYVKSVFLIKKDRVLEDEKKITFKMIL